MSKKSEPQITSNTRKEEFTRITFKPDLEKFGMAAIDDDIESLLKKRVYDLAGMLGIIVLSLFRTTRYRHSPTRKCSRHQGDLER